MTPQPTPPTAPLPDPVPGPLSAEAVTALLVDTSPYLSCDECFERMDSHVEALLADPHHDDPAMQRHLAGCPACQEEAESLMALLTDA